MKMVDSMVNTYAWMKLTSTSISNMNTEKSTEITEVPAAMPVPMALKMKISSVSTSTIM